MKVKAGLLCAALPIGCDSEVAGIKFESGFLVDKDTA